MHEPVIIMLSSITQFSSVSASPMLLLLLFNTKIAVLLYNPAMQVKAPLLLSSMDSSLAKILCIAMTRVRLLSINNFDQPYNLGMRSGLQEGPSK